MRSRGASNEIESSAWVGRSISLNDVIRSPQERRRHRQPKRLRCFQVEDQLEFGGLLDRQFAGLGTL